MALVPKSQVLSSNFPNIKTSLSSTNPYPKILKSSSRILKISASLPPNSEEKPLETQEKQAETDPLKLAFAKAKAYKKAIKTDPSPNIVQSPEKENDRNNGVLSSSNSVQESEATSGSDKGIGKGARNALPKKNVGKKGELTVSNIDFVGLGFADKKMSRGLPAGLVPLVDTFPEGDLPDVEILVGDSGNFGDTDTSKLRGNQEDDVDTYKPKVSTWGVFPRPNNISKTYGGGRTIRPGEALETAEEKETKDARTRQLLAAYKRKMGLTIDPKLKLECEKALNDGDYLMDLGKLGEALPFYEEVMDKLAFQTELHGLAALQWSICQDSLYRPNEARVMYEKLQSHPNAQVSKKARQFIFSFQAMDIMKVTGSTSPLMNSGYQNYFDAFIRDSVNYPLKEDEKLEEGAIRQAIPYIIFLTFPIFLVLLIALRKSV